MKTKHVKTTAGKRFLHIWEKKDMGSNNGGETPPVSQKTRSVDIEKRLANL
jgi:hypothetical protein